MKRRACCFVCRSPGATVWRVTGQPSLSLRVREAEKFLFGRVVTPRRIVEPTLFTLALLDAWGKTVFSTEAEGRTMLEHDTKREGESSLRYQNRKNRAQGAFFEQMINGACDFYRSRQIADIEKTPEPMQPTKDLGGGEVHRALHQHGPGRLQGLSVRRPSGQLRGQVHRR